MYVKIASIMACFSEKYSPILSIRQRGRFEAGSQSVSWYFHHMRIRGLISDRAKKVENNFIFKLEELILFSRKQKKGPEKIRVIDVS